MTFRKLTFKNKKPVAGFANWKSLVAIALLSATLGYGIAQWTSSDSGSRSEDSSSADGERKPLYWVAPMDPTYKRDKPGKSPMGMDLIPVYEESGDSGIKINATEAHNLAVKIGAARIGVLENTINTVGYVGFDENQITHIHTRVSGWIEQMYYKAEGDQVKAGDVLFELYSPELVNAQREFLTALKNGQSSLRKAARERLSYLGLSKSQIDDLQRSKKTTDRIAIKAPFSGVINSIKVGEGAYVMPAKEVMSIAKLDSVWINAEVLQRDAERVKVGDAVDIRIDGISDQSWQGVVGYVYPIVNPKIRTLRLRIEVDNDAQTLKPNMFAQLTIHSLSDAERVLIPKAALIRGPVNRVVVKTDDEHFQVKVVEPGRENNQWVEILKGLSGDEKLVVSSQFLIDSESNLDEALKRFEQASSHSEMDHSSQHNMSEGMKCGAGMDMSDSKMKNEQESEHEGHQNHQQSEQMKCGAGMDMSKPETNQHESTHENPFKKTEMKCGAGMNMSDAKMKHDKDSDKGDDQ